MSVEGQEERALELHNIGWASRQLAAGKKVRRLSWAYKEQYLVMSGGTLSGCRPCSIGYQPWDDPCLSVEDLLATDWELYEPEPEKTVLDKVVPSHYNSTKITPIEAIRDWGLGFSLGNALKYISRAGKKAGETAVDDLKKAKWYLEEEIAHLEGKATGND